jgi:hypothetical protein
LPLQPPVAPVDELCDADHPCRPDQDRAFVGTIDEKWLGLASEERQLAAEKLVGKLRDQGVEQIMIYDDQKKLRIQALGEKVRMP